MNEPRTAAGSDAGRTGFTVFLPLLLLSWSIVTLAGLQLYSLLQERDDLASLEAQQASALEEAKKIRAQLRSLAVGAADLAQAGNPNAQRLLDELARQGVRVEPSSASQ
ncbi:MAG: hypothetical protein D6727_03920 [Gammaproteobacteria bacterium]|nr:MAG: hypothetical protein D6727_03920 [Gammaproteobacteria bacterium]